MDAFICDAQRTPIGRYGGALSEVRTDDLAAIPIAALKARNPQVDWARLDDVILGDANQAGESNRNVARMAALLAGLPIEVPGTTINRLCASGMDAVGMAGARHQGPRLRPGHCRWRRKHVTRAFRHAKGHHGIYPQQCSL